MLFLFIFSVILLFGAQAQRAAKVPWNAPEGWLVVDLNDVFDANQTVIMEASPFGHFFTISDDHHVLTNGSVEELGGELIELIFTAKRAPIAVVLHVYVDNSTDLLSHFLNDVYTTLVYSSSAVGTKLVFREPIALRRSSEEGHLPPSRRLELLSGDRRLPFSLRSTGSSSVDLIVSKPLRNFADKAFVLYVGAMDKWNDVVAQCKVVVQLESLSNSETDETVTVWIKGPISANTIVFNFHDKFEGPTLYRLLDDDSKLFVVDHFTGAVVARKSVGYGRFLLDIVASSQHKKKRLFVLDVVVSITSQKAKNFEKRPRRHLDDVVFFVKENELATSKMRIPLYPGEKVGDVNTAKEILKIDEEGRVSLLKPLNYENTNSVIATVPVTGLVHSRVQTIRINVQDVDESPAFVNSPLPMLAVVPLNPTVGRIVYQLVARDEAGEGDSSVQYKLIDVVPEGSFTVDPKSGVVRTGWNKYVKGETYRVFVQAIDLTPTNNSTSQVSEVAKLEILAADRPPQFAKQAYQLQVPEDNLVDYSVVDVKAQSFRSIDDGRSKGGISYVLQGAETSPDEKVWFHVDAATGVVHLTRQLDYDDPALPKLHKLTVVAREDGKESRVRVDIEVADVNDNSPVFTRPLYTSQVREDVELLRPIIRVTAVDKDSGDNARITYAVDNENFTVNELGEIAAKARLDADQYNESYFIYRFNVTATDHGHPPRSSTAMVHIRTENTNDERAIFLPTSQYTAFVAEDAQGGTPVIQIQARDADRDEVSYAFVGKDLNPTLSINLFTIDKHTGLVRLRPGVTPADLAEAENPINLTVLATDDGSCCTQPSDVHSSYATLLIGIEDVNNNKPEFHDCAKYSEVAKILEGTYKLDAPTIVKLEATDDDSSANGDIIYSLYYTQSESRKAFVIDRHTGVLTPSPHVVFDREMRPREDVTVKATDRGDRPLIGFCQFSIEVVDVNDNAPQFERAAYETSVPRGEAVGTSVITVFAFDGDAAHNAEISYSLEADPLVGEEHFDDVTFFELVNRRSGEIALIKPIPYEKSKFVFTVVANDHGIPEPQSSSAQVLINVHDRQHKAPKWQISPDCKHVVSVVENAEISKVILRCHAISGDGSKSSIVYKLSATGAQHSAKADVKFRQFNKLDGGNEWAEVAIMEGLDYEQVNNYTLTLSATDVSSQVTATKTFTVLVQDVNDVVPQFTVDLFTGTIDEELTPQEYLEKFGGRPIVTVRAIDNDSEGPQNEVHYRIVETSNDRSSQLFRIDELTGEIFPNEKFDREVTDMYILTVEARDNSPSALPGASGPNRDNVKVQIVIGDVNDNAPSFEETKYVGRVKESEGEGHDVITIKAHDLDKHSNLRYHLVGAAGGRIPFGVRTDSGTIFVKEPLDYEQNDAYHLELIASDGCHNATTNVYINIDDVNDNAPVFEQPRYLTTVVEEDVDIPKVLFTVKAVDADMDEKSRQIVYRLEGQGADDVFRIGYYTGVIELVKPLDRDPPAGVPSWNFVVQAIDDGGVGLVGYADVQVNVRDINDNSPIFPEQLFGYIDENREPNDEEGVYFMDVQARDFDDPTTDNANIEYSIVANKLIDDEPVFRIDSHAGKIFAMRKLDRELASEREFVIEVRANDKGIPSREGSSNVTIKVLDKNDNAPFFEKTHYEGVVAETAPTGSAVMSFSAFDADIEAKDNVFTYMLAQDSDYFYMTTDKDSTQSSVGVLRVKSVLGLPGNGSNEN